MPYIDIIKADTSLIGALGEGNAHLVWTLALYLEEPDIEGLASQALTDGPDDKKIDFIYLDPDLKRIVFAQGYYSQTGNDSAPANKASDLNTAVAWLMSGDTNNVPETLKSIIEECRLAIDNDEIELIDLLYVHNLPESINVARELQTAVVHFRAALGEDKSITVSSKELGKSQIERIYTSSESQVEIREEIDCPSEIQYAEEGPNWKASVLSVPGMWLHELFIIYEDALFSANYRGFLGITRRKRINTGIRSSAELKSNNFWVFNNGITILTLGVIEGRGKITLNGISIINGAQTTGSLGSVDIGKYPLNDVSVLCRIIECTDNDTINEIIKYNNTQNEITTWDQYSNDTEQFRIHDEFRQLGHAYSKKRGFRTAGEQIGIEEVAQPLVAFHGRYKDANYGKNRIFEGKSLYNNAFLGKKARHVLFVFTLAKAIDERRLVLKSRSNNETIIELETQQLTLLRNIRFKFFFITVVANVLEALLNKRVDKETIGFTPEAAKSTNNTIIELTAMWTPIIEAILTFVSTSIDIDNFSQDVRNEAYLNEISDKVSAMLYATRGSLDIADFNELIAD